MLSTDTYDDTFSRFIHSFIWPHKAFLPGIENIAANQLGKVLAVPLKEE